MCQMTTAATAQMVDDYKTEKIVFFFKKFHTHDPIHKGRCLLDLFVGLCLFNLYVLYVPFYRYIIIDFSWPLLAFCSMTCDARQ